MHGVAKSQTQLSNKHSTQHRTWKQAKYLPTDEWIKMRYIHMMEYYSATKKNEMMPFAATWMDLEIITPRKINIIYDIYLE